MSARTRVLYVDDSALDRELVKDALTDDGAGFELTEAASREAFELAIREGGFDIVLSDFNILGFEGLQVLETVKELSPDTPVVIVTGTGSEEVAVEAMKRGAADYVIKSPSHIRRLPHTLRGVLEHRRVALEREQAIRERDLLFERSLDMLAVMGYDGNFKHVNPAWEEVLGWTSSELLSKPILSLVHPDDRESARQASAVLGAGDVVVSHECRWLTKDGGYRWIATSVRPWGSEQLVYSVGRDVTDKKADEERIARQVAMLKALHEIEMAITASETLEEVLNTLLERACTHLEVDAASVLLCDAEGGAPEFAAGKGFDSTSIREAARKMSEGYAGSAVVDRRVVHVPNLLAVGEQTGAENDEVVAYYGAPLIARNRVIGALEVFHAGAVQADADWLRFLEMLAEQAAVAIENAQMLERLQQG
jgi:PAS domain S-box-containing protein